MFAQIINTLSDLLYTYILIILLLGTAYIFQSERICPVPHAP